MTSDSSPQLYRRYAPEPLGRRNQCGHDFHWRSRFDDLTEDEDAAQRARASEIERAVYEPSDEEREFVQSQLHKLEVVSGLRIKRDARFTVDDVDALTESHRALSYFNEDHVGSGAVYVDL